MGRPCRHREYGRRCTRTLPAFLRLARNDGATLWGAFKGWGQAPFSAGSGRQHKGPDGRKWCLTPNPGPVCSAGLRGSAPAGGRIATIVAGSSRRGSAGASPSHVVPTLRCRNPESEFAEAVSRSAFALGGWGRGFPSPQKQCVRGLPSTNPSHSDQVSTTAQGQGDDEPPRRQVRQENRETRCRPHAWQVGTSAPANTYRH